MSYVVTVSETGHTVEINNSIRSSTSGISSLFEDKTPKLGGDLNINGFAIKLGDTGNLEIYNSDKSELLMKLDSNGNLGIKGSLYKL